MIKMGKRVPELSKITDSIILLNDTVLSRDYPYDNPPKESYKCPTCLRVFNSYQINDSRNRVYIRQSAQARRHYNRATCINQFRLVNKGYLRYTPQKGKPRLSNAIQYLLGFGKYKANPLQLIIYGLINGKLILKPNKTFYKPNIKGNYRIRMNHLISPENKRAVTTPVFLINVIGKIEDVDINIPKFKNRKNIETFVIKRLKTMVTYFRPVENMTYMPSIWNSETLRPTEKELNNDMENYLNIIGTTIPTEEYVGLLSQ